MSSKHDLSVQHLWGNTRGDMSHMQAAFRTSEQRGQGQETYPMLSMVGRLISFWRPRASRSYSANWGCPILPFTLACSIRQAACSSKPFGRVCPGGQSLRRSAAHKAPACRWLYYIHRPQP